MEKMIIVTMQDNSKWKIPCRVIAENMAAYYSGTDKKETYEKVYNEAMSNDDAILSWAEESMTWKDLKEHAEMIEPPNVDYEEGWLNGHKKIYEG